MNDKEIRKILISYLKADNGEVRIYQEKSIGSSICDVMTVTDCLTGYEIKSDVDNYQRLSSQVKSYNDFFDQNYIVVSTKHKNSATEKVPENWGILCIESDEIELIRQAKKNKKVSRFNQLSILWRLELNNILIKNNMPIFAQKSKNYIKSQIAKSIESSLLGKQISEELMKRDYSIFGADDYTIHSNSNVPEKEIIDSLSEEDGHNFTLDEWINLYKKAQEIKEEKNSIYKKAPKERKPHKIKYTDIEARLGAPWISKTIIEEFIHYIITGKEVKNSAICFVKYDDVTANWNIPDKNIFYDNLRITMEYGTALCNALRIIEASLNLRPLKVYVEGIPNELETTLALEKQRKINEEFKEWIWQSEDRIWEVEEAYNNSFGEFEKRKYDGSTLEFPELADGIELFDYQKNAIKKIITEKNTLLALDVGAGKTYIMIAAAMKMRQEGLSRKNLFVVPNNIVGQWEKMFTTLYPKAKILTVDSKTFKPLLREKVLSQIRDGDYDGIIMAYSCFEMIPLSCDYINKQMINSIEELSLAVNNYNRYSFEQENRRKEEDRIRNLAAKLIASMDKKPIRNICFDELEIGTIFLDEAHNYKNIPIKTKMRDLTGINTTGSQKCLEMQSKVLCVQEQNGGRGAVFATGTPLCNSISDAYAMQMYLQRDKMHELKLDIFDNWVKTFAAPEVICEIDVDTSKFRMIRRFAKFFNLRELSKMFSSIAFFHAVEPKGLPTFNGYTDVVIKKNKPLKDYMLSLCERTELIRAKIVDRSYDNMLKVSTDGRKAALDLTLVGKKQSYNQTSKVFKCAENVFQIYNKYPNTSQLIFCDYSTPKSLDFDVYNKIKKLLIAKGIDEKEIAFVHSYQTEARKLKLYEQVNSGKVRVLIGSTFKLGIGANVQTKLKAVHHLDVPWRPADMVQREGRILRNGNENKDVFIYRYIAEGSFDSYSWQILETKQNFISQFLSGSTYQKSIEDLEENVLSYAEVKALALANPLMKEKAEKENELKNLLIVSSRGNENERNLKIEYDELKVKISKQEERLSNTKRNGEYIKDLSKLIENTCKKYNKTMTNDFIYSRNKIWIYDFGIYTPDKQNEKKPYLIVERLNTRYTFEVSNSPSGNAIRLNNFFSKFDKQIKKDEEILQKMTERKINIENHKAKPEYAHKIQVLKTELAEIESKLNLYSA